MVILINETKEKMMKKPFHLKKKERLFYEKR
jgi:hypothetical protein